MDKINLQAFSDDNFDATNWINEVFRSTPPDTNYETFASNTAFKLQLFVQEVNNSLEETAQQMLTSLPKVVRESETLQMEACQLRDQMKTAKEKLMKLEQESSQSMVNLVEMDKIKTRMEESCQALREADNWTTLSMDVEEVFASGDVHAIASKLVGMQRSLEILVDVPDYQQRMSHLDQLKDRFEAMLEMATINSFTVQTGDAHIYVKLFKDIKRIERLKKHYHNCLLNQLTVEWKRIIQVDPEENLLDWLNLMYDSLLLTWHSQTNFCQQVIFHNDFDSTLDVLCNLLVDVLKNLDPPILSCIKDLMSKQTNPLDNLNTMIDMKQITERFAKSIELSLTNTGNSKCLEKEQVKFLLQVLYAPVKDVIDLYEAIEKQVLMSDLANIKSVSQPSESINKTFYYAKEAEKRCHQLTYSVATPSLANALESYFNNYLNHFSDRINSLRSKAIANEKSSIPDWSLFQLSLFNLQASGELVLQTEQLQQQLLANITEVSRKMPSSFIRNISPFVVYHDLLLNPPAKQALLRVINKMRQRDKPPILESINTRCKEVCAQSANVVFDVALFYIEKHLTELNFASNGTSESDLHSFSLSPQENITQIGQYLLTIPQHIEPFIVQENNAFKTALSHCELKSVNKTGMITDSAAEFLLDCITQGTIDAFISKILKLKKLNAVSKQQLIIDIGYLNDVLEDLGRSPGDELQKLHALLKAPAEEFHALAAGTNPVIVRAVEALIKPDS